MVDVHLERFDRLSTTSSHCGHDWDSDILVEQPITDQDFADLAKNLQQPTMDDNLIRVQKTMEPLTFTDQLAVLTWNKNLAGTLIVVAIKYNSLQCLRYFLELLENHKEDLQLLEINQNDKFNSLRISQTSLQSVAMLEQYSKLLYNILNQRDDEGSTPLLTAITKNEVELAKYLVRNHARFDFTDINGQSPIKAAVMKGNIEILAEMLKMVLPGKRSQLFTNSKLFGKGHTIFYAVALSGKEEVFDYLVGEMSDVFSYLDQEISHPEFQKFLKYIIGSGMESPMSMLIDHYDEVLETKIEYGNCTPLRWAVKKNQTQIVKLIVNKKVGRQTAKLEDENGKNVFHYAAEASEAEILECLINMRGDYSELYCKKDKRGCPPLHHATVAGLSKNVTMLLDYDCEMNEESIFHCQFCVKHSSYEILESILLKFKNCDEASITRFLQSQNMAKRTPVHEAAFAGRPEILQLLIKDIGASVELKSSYFNWTALHFAVAGKSLPTVKFLIQKCPQMVNWRSDADETAGVLAAQSGCAQILRYILDNGGKVYGEYRRENLLDCVTEHPHVQNQEDAALVIVKFCDNDGEIDLLEKLMNNSKYGPEGIMSKLFKHMPRVALEILNTCVKKADPSEFHYTHTYNFFPIQDVRRTDGKDLEAIQSMVKYESFNCLRHPVVVKFLDMKWNCSAARMCYFFNVIMYVAFLFSMTLFIVLQTSGHYKVTSPALIGLSLMSIAVILCNVVKEIIQIRFGWRGYFFDLNNYLEWMVYISASIYLIPPSQEKTNAQIEAGAVAVFLAWINFIWFFKILSLFGIYIIMAKRVFTSLLKVLPMVVLFIFAFSMVFFLLMSKDEGYHSIPVAMLTTSVMMAGEIDFRDVFLANEDGPHILLERLFLLCFLMIITIVIMNLLIGLAVGDTDKTMKWSKAEKLLHRASLIVTWQRSFSHLPWSWIRLREIEGSLKVNLRLRKKKSRLLRIWEKVYGEREVDNDSETQILSRLENVEESIDHMKSLLVKISSQMNIAENKKCKA